MESETLFLTPERERRVIQAIDETLHLIDKEEAHRPSSQKVAYLASLRAHLAKLQGMLEPHEIS